MENKLVFNDVHTVFHLNNFDYKLFISENTTYV